MNKYWKTYDTYWINETERNIELKGREGEKESLTCISRFRAFPFLLLSSLPERQIWSNFSRSYIPDMNQNPKDKRLQEKELQSSERANQALISREGNRNIFSSSFFQTKLERFSKTVSLGPEPDRVITEWVSEDGKKENDVKRTRVAAAALIIPSEKKELCGQQELNYGKLILGFWSFF